MSPGDQIRHGGHRSGMRLAPEGADIIILSAVLVVAAVAFSLLRAEGRGLWLPAVAALWFLAVVQFFRDPNRVTPAGDNLIIAPADGKVIAVGEALDSPLNPPGQRVSIFMSPINVHVNRAPVAGTVKERTHRNGRFFSAFKAQAARDNEQTLLVLGTPFGDVAIKQVAGFLARRIICHPKPGDKLSAGARIGMIRFGSRVDLFLPGQATLKVRVGDRVTAGETIVGVFENG